MIKTSSKQEFVLSDSLDYPLSVKWGADQLEKVLMIIGTTALQAGYLKLQRVHQVTSLQLLATKRYR